MWFRRDLRLEDNPALVAAVKASQSGKVTPLFVLDPMFLTRSGAPRLAFLFRSLRDLNSQMGGALVVRIGNPVDVVAQVAKEVDAIEVFAAKDFAPYGQKRDVAVSKSLAKVGAKLNHVGSPYAIDPGTVRCDIHHDFDSKTIQPAIVWDELCQSEDKPTFCCTRHGLDYCVLLYIYSNQFWQNSPSASTRLLIQHRQSAPSKLDQPESLASSPLARQTI